MKVIDLENIPFCSINKKYGYSPRSNKLYLSKEYRDFKKLIAMTCKKVKIDKPYRVEILFSGKMDIDAMIKPILDALESVGVLENDKYVYELEVKKTNDKINKLLVWITHI